MDCDAMSFAWRTEGTFVKQLQLRKYHAACKYYISGYSRMSTWNFARVFFWMFLYGSYEFHTSKYWSICSVSVPPYSHMHGLVLDDINHRPGQSIMQDKQKKASNKLRKGIYIPPRIRWRSLNLYYRDDARNILNEKNKKEDDNDYYRCAICLEDFEPRQEVMVTPCSHVFHGECILPRVKSSSRCPVCRFAIPQ